MQRLLKLCEASAYLSMCETTFNKLVRNNVPEMQRGKNVIFDRLDIDEWVVQFKEANGKPKMEATKWQRKQRDLKNAVKSGTSKKLSSVNSFDAALAKRNSKKQNAI